MKKLTLLTTVLILFFLNGFSQLQQWEDYIAQQAMNNAPYIIEGTVIEGESYKTDENLIVSSNLIQIDKIFYGDDIPSEEIRCGRIEVITKGGEIDGDIAVVTPGPSGPLSPDLRAIFLLYPSDFNGIRSGLENEIDLHLGTGTSAITINEEYEENGLPAAGGLYKVFDNHKELYSYIDSLGFNHTNCTPSIQNKAPIDPERLQKVKESIEEGANELNYEQKKRNYRERQEYIEKALDSVKSQGAIRSSESLDITYENPRMTGNNPSYLEFDLMIKGNSNNTYLDNSPVWFEYNSNAFGTQIAANNKINITLGPDFDPGVYSASSQIGPIDTVISGKNVVILPFGLDMSNGPFNRTQITTSKKLMMTVKMQIANCNESSQIDSIGIYNTQIVSSYSNSQTGSPDFLSYDNISYTPGIKETLCVPEITSFTPSTISAGNGKILTVNGNFFGQSRGTGQIQLKNSDRGGTYDITAFDAYDYISWSDNQIKIMLPQLVDTLKSFNPILPDKPYHPGSGPVTIKNRYGFSETSITPLTIKYAIKNLRRPAFGQLSDKKKFDLANANDGGSYTFHLHPSVRNNPDAVKCIEKAIKDWNCATGVNFKIGSDTNISSSNQDGVSMIYFNSNTVQPGEVAIAETTVQSPTFCTGQDTFYMFAGEMDIQLYENLSHISPGASWMYDTTMTVNKQQGQADFYAVIAHELGHAHLLSHVNDPQELLWWKDDVTQTVPANQRRGVQWSLYTVEGGQEVVQSATEASFNENTCDVGYFEAVYPDNCSSTGYQKLSRKKSGFSVFPNPTSQNLNIQIKNDKLKSGKLILTDVSGREVKRTNINRGRLTLPVKDMVPGLYVLTIQNNSVLESKKVVIR
ncbi:T9SS type A sorting domain-containing protein [Salibacter halophilus]|uniref:T9SS type A sorting domain-containing protein n=1 Tax=Salibacter halophilus TaxID=1803916 RepID=A0A6N6M457_9FLAO|nr:T9SS type A sorting domain-containing protein [Salibacter halophilus]KAB1064070.1 T9SS type A sorting domain-containing protein [Salibacter halophilus]